MDDEITTADAAEILGVSLRQMQWYHEKGHLKGRRVGARLLVFRRAAVETFTKPKKTGRPRKAVENTAKSNGKIKASNGKPAKKGT